MFGRKSNQPMTVEQKRRQLDNLAKKRPTLLKRMRNRALLLGLIGAVGGAQGPAMKQHYNSTGDSMLSGVEMAQNINQPTSQKVKHFFSRKNEPSVIAGDRMMSGTDKKGAIHIGRVDIAAQSVKTYRPTMNLGMDSAKAAGKGAAAGAVAGVALGVAGYRRKKKKYDKKMRELIQ